MTERTYKLFDHLEERFNLNRRTFANIEAVCRVMTECDFLSPSDAAYYAQIADLPTEEEDGQKYYRFNQKWSKGNYLLALMPALFVDVPALFRMDSKGVPQPLKSVEIGGVTHDVAELRANVDAEEVYSALGFFLACIGWTLHDQSGALALLEALQSLNKTSTPSGATFGETELSTN
jgi:hypothetical protein